MRCSVSTIPRCTSRLFIRHIALEKLVKVLRYPCSYQRYGCVEVFVHDMVHEHQDRCHYRPQTCSVKKLTAVKRDWTGIYQDIKEHLMEEHPGDCYKYRDGKFRTLKYIAARMCVSQFVLALNEVFCLRFQANNDIFYVSFCSTSVHLKM
jgi:hypothetical protein